MIKILSLFAVLALVVLPTAVFGGGIFSGETGAGNPLGGFMTNVLTFINTIVIPFILAIGFLVFVWGVFQYFIIGGSNDEAKTTGRSLIMYAIGGFVIILAFWGIINIISNGIGLEQPLDSTPAVNTTPVNPTTK